MLDQSENTALGALCTAAKSPTALRSVRIQGSLHANYIYYHTKIILNLIL